MIEEIENYINGEDYPDEIPKRIMGLFEREHADLLAENALLASQIRLAYEWVEAFHNEDTMISFIEHVYGDEEE